MAKNKNKGAGLPAPTPGNSQLSARNPINPHSILWDNLSKSDKQRMYKLAQGAANERFRSIERKGREDQSPIYESYKKKGYKTASGNVGLSSAGYLKWGTTQLKYEYIKAYNVLTAPSTTSSDKKYQEKMEDMLSRVGVFYDDILEISKDKTLPQDVKDKLNDYWSLYNEAKEIGLWSKFGLGSYEAQEIVQEVMLNMNINKMPKHGKGATITAKVAKQKALEYNAYADKNELNSDIYRQKKMVLEFNEDKIQSLSDALLYQIGLRKWGRLPLEPVSTGDIDDEGYSGFLG